MRPPLSQSRWLHPGTCLLLPSLKDRTGVVSGGKQCWGLLHPRESWKLSSQFKCSFLLAFPGKARTLFFQRKKPAVTPQHGETQ